ncbi:hypothetical protein [Massilia sp. DWR3-1-1]|uniref:hypothetical protein n=1 Tax=Massilia sp. DWR3-1-1 TaxID=2804559 RepID=UPI003CFA3F67
MKGDGFAHAYAVAQPDALMVDACRAHEFFDRPHQRRTPAAHRMASLRWGLNAPSRVNRPAKFGRASLPCAMPLSPRAGGAGLTWAVQIGSGRPAGKGASAKKSRQLVKDGGEYTSE